GLVITMNRASGSAEAAINGTKAPNPTIGAGGGVSVTAEDRSEVHATIQLTTLVVSADLTQPPRASAVAGPAAPDHVRGGATAHIDNATVTASGGSIVVTASEDATINADLTTEAEAIAASFKGQKALAINGIIATNLVLSSATATVTGSVLNANSVAT